MTWFGLLVNGNLYAVIQSPTQPLLHDFNMPLFSWNNYEVVCVTITW